MHNAESSHGILINVNIQNLITPKNLISMQTCGLQKDDNNLEANLGNGNINHVANGNTETFL